MPRFPKFFSLALLLATPSFAAVEYSHRIWRTQDGLPQSEIRAIAQTSDGYLWIGSSGGLARFDGVRFVVFDRSNTPAFHDDGILSLLASRDKSLWIGTDGGGLLHYRNGQFETYGAKEGLTNLFVRALLEGRDGTLWIGTDRGFFRFKAGRLERLDGSGEVPVASVTAMVEDRDGKLWVGGQLGLMVMEHGRLSRHSFNATIRSIYAAADGTLWFATAVGLRTLTAERMTEPPGGLAATDARDIYGDRDGNLWIGTVGDGLIRLRNGVQTTYREDDFLPDNSVLAVFQDREENLWMGTQDGLLRLNKTVVTLLTTRNGLTANNTLTTYQDPHGRLWITTVTGRIYRVEGERAIPFDPAPSAGFIRAGNMYEDRAGVLWIGTLNQGIARIEGGKATFYTTADGLRNDQVRQVLEDSHGNLWIATGSGLVRWLGGRFQVLYLEDGLAYGSVRVLLELHNGDVLVGTDGGLNRVHGIAIVGPPLLAGEKIWSLWEDAGGTVWIGTRGGGLFRLKGEKITRLQTPEGLLSNSIYQILDDGHGRLWMSSPAGIFSSKLADLNAVADGKAALVPVVPYGIADGLESVKMKGGLQSAGCRTNDGKLWFPSAKGAVRIDPAELHASSPSPVIIEAIFADEKPVPLNALIRIPAGETKMEIDYTACVLRSPERITFKYKLEGFDKDWTPASNRRVAYYTNLPPASYRFRVAAMDASSESNASETALEFQWAPQFYQTLWFRAICVLCGGFALWAAFHLYGRQTKGRYAVLLAERTRLAREMHDTLIQGCVGVSTLLEAAGSVEDSNHAQSRNLVEKARVQVRLTLEEARQAVWDLRHSSLHGGLAADLKDFAGQLSADHEIDVQVAVTGSAGLPQEADRNLLLVAREAIRNALSHGHPRHIAVALSFEADAVRLEVSDDGSGFDAGSVLGPDDGHYGILGMRERVAQLGGSFDLFSTPGQGARVLVSVPLTGGVPVHE